MFCSNHVHENQRKWERNSLEFNEKLIILTNSVSTLYKSLTDTIKMKTYACIAYLSTMHSYLVVVFDRADYTLIHA